MSTFPLFVMGKIKMSAGRSNGEQMEKNEEEHSVAELLRVDHCLICGETAVYYDVGGALIKRERSSPHFSYQQLFDCLCQCLELRKNCKLKKDWDFYKDPFPACGTCEQLLVSLAELYSKVELAEEELRSLFHSSEEKYLSCNLYEKHEDKYRSFRKQVLKKAGILEHESKRTASRNVFPNEKETKTQSDVQPEVSGDNSSLSFVEALDDLYNSNVVSLELTNDRYHLDPHSLSQPILSFSNANTRRTLRNRATPSFFSPNSDSDNKFTGNDSVSERGSQPSSESSRSTSPDNDVSRSEVDGGSDEDAAEIIRSKKCKRQATSNTTTKRKASPIKTKTPASHPSLNKRETTLLTPKRRKYIFHKNPTIVPTATFSRCPVCDKPIRKNALQEYREHYWSHLNDEEKRAYFKDNDVPDLSTIPPIKKRQITHRKAAPFPERVKSGDVIQCQTCGKFVGKDSIGRHQKTHLSVDKRKTHLCNLCGASFVQKVNLSLHLQSKHPDGSGVSAAFKCQYPGCNSSYTSEADLKAHVKDAHSSASSEHQNKYLCEDCGRILANKQLLKQHGLVHSKVRKHICHHCSKTYPLKTTLVMHLQAVHGEGKKVFMCEQIGCGLKFPARAYYSAHLRNVHGIYVGRPAKGSKKRIADSQEKTKFVCDVCGVVFNHNVSLQAHLSKVHPTGKEGAYACLYPSCTSNFFTEPDLQNHVQQEHVANYKGDKHLCGLCGRLVKHACSLKVHQVVHTKERNHVCHICSKAFPLKTTLVMHLEAVHGEGKKEFKCEQEGCTQVFPTRVYFMAHMRNVHGIYVKGKRSSVKRMCTKL